MTVSSVIKGSFITLGAIIGGVIMFALSPLLLLLEMSIGPLVTVRFARGDTPYLLSDEEEALSYDHWTTPEGCEKVELTGWEGQPLWAFKTLNWDNSRPTVLLLHGWPDDATEWAEFLTEMHKRGTTNCIALTQRGAHKDTIASKNGYSGYAMAKDIEALFDDERSGLSKDHKVHLVGHDWGGYFAAITIRKFPELFETVSFVAVPYARFFLNAVAIGPRQALSSWYMGVFLTPLAGPFLLGKYRFFRSKTTISDFGSLDPNQKLSTVPKTDAEGDVEAQIDTRITNAHKIRTGVSYLLNANLAKPYSRKYLVYCHAKMLNPKLRKAQLNYYSSNIFNMFFSAIIGFSLIGYLVPKNQRITARINNIVKVSVPSLHIACGEDKAILTSTMKYCANPKHFPKGLRFIQLKEAGHAPMVEETLKMADMFEAMALSGLEGVDQLEWNK